MSTPALPASWLHHLVRRLIRRLMRASSSSRSLGATLALLAALTGALHPLLGSVAIGSQAGHGAELCMAAGLAGQDPVFGQAGPATSSPAVPGDTQDSTGHAHCALGCSLGKAAAFTTHAPKLPALAARPAGAGPAPTPLRVGPVRLHAQARAPPSLSRAASA
ncbi:MAG: hypothetical protein RIQ60_3442 [Pseudomonadota bacterium]|jgi:hypothetical protein